MTHAPTADRVRRRCGPNVGGTYGAITAAVEEAQMEGKSVASDHIRHLNPLPPDLGQILRQYRACSCPRSTAASSCACSARIIWSTQSDSALAAAFSF